MSKRVNEWMSEGGVNEKVSEWKVGEWVTARVSESEEWVSECVSE